jgi:selenide,water dikinase
MGGTPVTALNLVAFPLEQLGGKVLREILRGGEAVAAAAGVAIVGGHSIDDPEPKYGLAVTGTAHPDDILSNATACAGDLLVLTKPLGAGAVATAAKRGMADPELVERAVTVMVELNREAAEAARAAGAHAMTDVTGFGLLGHLHELAAASALAAEIDARRVPAIEGVLELLADERAVSGGARANAAYSHGFARLEESIDPARRRLMVDPMTSGGLLVAVAPDGAALVPGVVVGRLAAGAPGQISVRG